MDPTDANVAAPAERTAVVLLHGSADTPQAWRGVVSALGDRFAVDCPALPALTAIAAAGAASADSGSADRGSALAIDLPWLTAHMQQQGARILVGHSYGGLLALRWALQNPLALDALVLIEPIAWGVLRQGRTKDHVDVGLLEACASLFAHGEAAQAMANLVDYWNGGGTWMRLPAAVRDQLLAQVARTAAEVRAGATDRTTAQEFATLQGHVALLCGAQTTDASRWVQHQLASARPATKFKLVDGAAHGLVRSHPAEVAAILCEVAHLQAQRQHRSGSNERGNT